MTITTRAFGFLMALIGAYLLTVINPNMTLNNGERSTALDFSAASLILFGLWVAQND